MAETYYIGKLTGEITKLSQLENDTGFITEELDPVYKAEKENSVIDGGEV